MLKNLILTLSSFTLIFYIYVSYQSTIELRQLLDANEAKLAAISLYHSTRLVQKTSQLLNVEEVELCNLFKQTPTKISLYNNKTIEIYDTQRPDRSFNFVGPFERGKFSVHDGEIWASTENSISGQKRKRTLPILELNRFKEIAVVNIESEASKENCL